MIRKSTHTRITCQLQTASAPFSSPLEEKSLLLSFLCLIKLMKTIHKDSLHRAKCHLPRRAQRQYQTARTSLIYAGSTKKKEFNE